MARAEPTRTTQRSKEGEAPSGEGSSSIGNEEGQKARAGDGGERGGGLGQGGDGRLELDVPPTGSGNQRRVAQGERSEYDGVVGCGKKSDDVVERRQDGGRKDVSHPDFGTADLRGMR